MSTESRIEARDAKAAGGVVAEGAPAELIAEGRNMAGVCICRSCTMIRQLAHAHMIIDQALTAAQAREAGLREALAHHEGKRAPVQGFKAGIPWDMHLQAYDVYSAKWAPQPAMIDLEGRNCRGGFSINELDMFIPGWRDELQRRGDIARAALSTPTPEAPDHD